MRNSPTGTGPRPGFVQEDRPQAGGHAAPMQRATVATTVQQRRHMDGDAAQSQAVGSRPSSIAFQRSRFSCAAGSGTSSVVASGTATLEATLVGRPMVVAYRLSLLTTFLLKTLKLFKAPFFAQPNLLAGRQVVPEYFNDEVRADVLGPAVLTQLGRADRDQLVQTFASIHETLRRDASARAAEAIVELLRSGER